MGWVGSATLLACYHRARTLTQQLPIHALRGDFDEALAAGPVVLSSPTGSGKSTEVPRWCPGRVVVIEPRRIACRSLAARVAELERSELGDVVGYLVRDEQIATPSTRIVFATPGMALRHRELLSSADSIVLDEFHERNLDTDLLLALLLPVSRARLVVMSATLEGERVAKHVRGKLLTATGKAFEVGVKYLASGGEVMPHAGDLAGRVQRALEAADRDPGDVLVFLPGKAEIEECAQSLRGRFSVVPLHGGLSLSQQRRAFEPMRERKVVLATNVAETSLTIPGIGVVIDSGLVRQTRYHDGRSYLVRGPIAQDSAAQRSGRAGRTGPGVCYRLWSASAQLQPVTVPEIQRESLVMLLLAASAWGRSVESLPLLDAPKPHAIEAARAQLQAWGALHGTAELSDTGRLLFELPVAPAHARLLVEARKHECLDDMIDLVSVLSVGRPVFEPRSRDLPPDDDLRAAGCDASAAIAALRAAEPAAHGAAEHVVREARAARERLRRSCGLPRQAPSPAAVQREALLSALLSADPQLCHVSRGRGRERYFSNGGTELALARESAANRLQKLDAVLALETRAFGAGRDAQRLITCAVPLPLGQLARAGLGDDRLGHVRIERSRVVAQVERVYAQRVIAEREEVPTGRLAREAFVCLLLRGSLFREAVALTTERLGRAKLAAALAKRGHALGVASSEPIPAPDAWLAQRIEALGVESGEDLALLSAADVTAPDLPYEVRSGLDEQFPLQVSVGDAVYRAEYDLTQNQVLLQMIKGSRSEPPPLSYLPKFTGLRICVAGPRGTRVVRQRG